MQDNCATHVFFTYIFMCNCPELLAELAQDLNLMSNY